LIEALRGDAHVGANQRFQVRLTIGDGDDPGGTRIVVSPARRLKFRSSSDPTIYAAWSIWIVVNLRDKRTV
jgi:hypothetical protein